MEYKNTIITPKTDFPMKAGLPAREPGMLARWEEMELYEAMLEKIRGPPEKISKREIKQNAFVPYKIRDKGVNASAVPLLFCPLRQHSIPRYRADPAQPTDNVFGTQLKGDMHVFQHCLAPTGSSLEMG